MYACSIGVIGKAALCAVINYWTSFNLRASENLTIISSSFLNLEKELCESYLSNFRHKIGSKK